jgi:alkylhydroperoxidase/carboxymuconolactone decarboxylase family protein YurZ
MTATEKSLADQLADVFGTNDESLGAVAEMDPAIARAFLKLEAGTRKRGALEPKYRALVSMCLSASPTHLKEKHTRLHMADALRHGATQAEICETLELASVLGIHGFIPGVQILLEHFGGIEAVEKMLSPEQLARAKEAAAAFEAKRGFLGDVWWANCLLSPDFVEGYSEYSGTPWATSALPGKIKELIYVAIDLSPTHGDVGGATFHMKNAMDRYGATLDEVMEVLEIIGLMGFQTHMMSLPILREELARIG